MGDCSRTSQHRAVVVTEKVRPVVLRLKDGRRQLLVFRHPLAATQLVKGTLEEQESVEAGAVRELREESGLLGQAKTGPAWSSDPVAAAQIWHFVPVTVSSIADRFSFFTKDDGGHVFSFFCWDLDRATDANRHPIFIRALAEVRLHYS